MLKIVLLRRRFALSDISTEKVTFEDDGAVLYDFPTLAKSIGGNLTTDASISGLTQSVEDQAPGALSGAFRELDRYACYWEHGGQMEGRQIAQYVVAGYENGTPVVSSVEFYPDWKAHRVGLPVRIPYQLPKSQSIDARYQAFGVDDPHGAICDSHTDANSAPVSNFFTSQRIAFCSADFPRLSLEEASIMVRFLLEFESRIHSEFVGLPFTVISIPKGGSGHVRSFRRFHSGADRLSNQHATKQN